METLADRIPVVVVLVALGAALIALVEWRDRRRHDREARARRDVLEQLGRGTGDH